MLSFFNIIIVRQVFNCFKESQALRMSLKIFKHPGFNLIYATKSQKHEIFTKLKTLISCILVILSLSGKDF